MLMFPTRNVDDRLECLNEAERMEWLSKCVPNLVQLYQRTKNPLPRDDGDSVTPMDSGNDFEQPDTSRESDSASREQQRAKRRSECSTKRKKIRSEKEWCSLCHYHSTHSSAAGNVGGKSYKKMSKLGCPGCDMIICEQHWADFDHNLPEDLGE